MSNAASGKFIITFNGGSSSIKFALFSADRNFERRFHGAVDRIGLSGPTFSLKNSTDGSTETNSISAHIHSDAVRAIISAILSHIDPVQIRAIGHRIVHGGPSFAEPITITQSVVSRLERISDFAPEHLPGELEIIAACRKYFPRTQQVACFDTAFHSHLPNKARMLPLPRRYFSTGIRRYGFHGLSFESLMQQLETLNEPAAKGGRVVLAHLGNGASMAAVLNGKCIDTTMGFTPAGGLVMSRRTGDLDPGALAYIVRRYKLSPSHLHRLVHHESGLLGVSNISSDMRELLAAEKRSPAAADAINLFCYQASKFIAGMAVALGGIDALVFSGGIGENNYGILKRICDPLAFIGIKLNPKSRFNARGPSVISAPGAPARIHVLHTDEERIIAQAVNTCVVREG